MSGVEFADGARGPYTPPPPTAPPPAAATVPPPEFVAEDLEPPTTPPGGPRMRAVLGPQSLTARLVSGIVVLVLLLETAIGTATYYRLRGILTDRLDQQLATTAPSGTNASRYSNYGPTPQDVYVVALDMQTGQVLYYPNGAEGAVALRLDRADRLRLAGMDSGTPRTVQALDGTWVRVLARQGFVTSDFADIPATVVTGLSMTDERRTLSKLVYFEMLVGAAALLIAMLATTYGVRFSLRRLRRVTSTAQEVAAELSPEGAGLDRRVPDDQPDTEVGQLATSFNTLLAAVEQQFKARLESEHRMRQFMADASHELRTPLTSIRGFAELARMQRAAGTPVDADGTEPADDNLARIESEGTRMSRLVEDLLLLARGDSDGDRVTEREYIAVAELLDDAAAGARAAFPDRPIDVDVTAAPHVVGDRDQLLRVVRNLVTNAAVHTAAGRPIQLRGTDVADGVVIQVIDGGPGLPQDEAAHVFERFWRADKARTRARGGSGLGLSIVASIVAAHGGRVRFDSSVETGSTVTVWLPSA